MSRFTFYLEGNAGIGRVTQLQSRNRGQIICVMDQSFTHQQPRLPSRVHMSCSCLYFSPGRVQGLSPVSFAKTLPSRPYTLWLLLSLFRHLFIRMDWNPVCWKQTWLLSWPAWGFHPLPQSLSSWAARLSIYSSSGCFSQPGWVRGPRAMLETAEICPEGNSRNTGGRTADHCKLVCFLPLTPTLQSYLQDFIQPPRRCKHMFASTYVRKTSRLKSPSHKYVYRHLGLNTNWR